MKKLTKEQILKPIMEVVNRQAKDWGLWFPAHYITEDYLQKALRELHAVIEEQLKN